MSDTDEFLDDEFIENENSNFFEDVDADSQNAEKSEPELEPEPTSSSFTLKQLSPNFCDDCEKIPEGSEKAILRLIWCIHSFLERNLERNKISTALHMSDIKTSIKPGYENLKNCLANEYSESELNGSDMREWLAKIEQAMNKAYETAEFFDWYRLIDYFKQFLSLLRPLDFEEVFRLIDETRKAPIS